MDEPLSIQEKYMLSLKEASEYYSIGIKSMRRLAEKNNRSFTIFNGTHYLIVRHLFEEFLLNNLGEDIMKEEDDDEIEEAELD